MKLLKKTFALMLSLILVVGMIPGTLMTVYAAGTEITEAELFEQIQFTSSMIDGSPTVQSNSFIKTKGDGWELKYSQSGRWLYFDLYLDNADIDGVNLIGKLLKDSAISVCFNVHVKGECSIGGLWFMIQHTDPKYGWGGSDAEYSRLETNIIYESDNATLSAENSIQTKGLYNVDFKVNANGNSGATLKCSFIDTTALASVSSITMTGVNFVAKQTSGTGAVFNVGDCTITFNKCNTLFNLPEGMVPFADGHNNVIYDTTMVEYGGKLEIIKADNPAYSSWYVDSNRYAAIMKSADLTNYLNFINQDPAMPSGKTETDITATLDNTETYQFNNAALPSWLADGGFDVYRSWEHSKDGSTIVGNGNSADDLMTYSYNYTNAGTYKFVEELTLKYFNDPVDNFVDAHNGYKKNTFNITTTEGSGEGGETSETTVNVVVTAPVAGEFPDFNATTDNAGFTIEEIRWCDNANGYATLDGSVPFVGGNKYQCVVFLEAKEGYDLASIEKVTINGNTATYGTAGSAEYYYYDFTATGGETPEIDLVNVTVTEPEAGKTPAVPVVETENVMLVTSTWKEEGKTEKATTFEAGKTYVLEVLVNPEIDYDFATNPAVKINGKDATVTHSSPTAIMCSYKFAVPEEGGETPPTEYDITVTGGTASANKAVAGTSITLTAEQIDGKVFSHWEVNGATVSDANAKETTFTMGNADVTAEAIYDDCECKCHKGGIVGFFYKIVLFFQKLFGNNLVCNCGKKH